MRRSHPEPLAGDAPAAAHGSELEDEIRGLRARLAALTEQVSRNDSLLRKTQERELELLRAGSLAQLCSGRLEQTLRFVCTQSPRRHTQFHAIGRRQVGEREWRDFCFDGTNALRERGFSDSCRPD